MTKNNHSKIIKSIAGYLTIRSISLLTKYPFLENKITRSILSKSFSLFVLKNSKKISKEEYFI